MLSVTILGHARSFSNRARLFSGVMLSALVIGAVAKAQQRPTSPQQQEQQTPSAPAQSQQPASEPPAANSPTGQTQLPQIVVAGGKPKSKPKRSVQAPQPVAQDAPTPAQAALNAPELPAGTGQIIQLHIQHGGYAGRGLAHLLEQATDEREVGVLDKNVLEVRNSNPNVT